MEPVSVQSLPLHRPVILNKSNTLKQAARAMEHNQVGSVLVSDGRGVLRGLFTDRDLALALGLENVQTSTPLATATHTPLLYVSEDASLSDVTRLMGQFGVRRVPVVKLLSNGRQKCIGIITLDDLIKNNLITMKEEIQILRNQLKTPKELMARSHMKNIFHSQDHKEQSFHLFLKNIEVATGLNRPSAKSFTIHVLDTLLRRIPLKARKSLVSQLPYELQMQLIPNAPVGALEDRSITAKGLLGQIKKRYKVDSEGAAHLLHGFWQGLEKSVSEGELKTLLRQVPKEFTFLFMETAGTRM
jgi:IMP dehydrogenase